jgi:hypothetical protein
MKWKLKEKYKGSLKQSWLFERINKVDKPLAKPEKRERRPKLMKIEKKKGDIITDSTET